MRLLEDILVMSLAVAAISYTIARGKIFATHRKWISRRSTWFGSLINCPFCVSHWVAAALVVATALRPLGVWRPLDYLIGTQAVVCVSAFALGLINRAFPPKKSIPEIEPPLPPPPTSNTEMWHQGWSTTPQSAIDNWGRQPPPESDKI